MSDPTHHRPPRPFGIVVLEILALVQGGFTFLLGLFVALGHDDGDLVRAARLSKDQLLYYGVVLMLVGAVVFLLGLLLGRGSQTARVVFAFFAVLSLASGIHSAIAFVGEQRMAGVVSAVFSGVVLWILFSHSTQEYYDRAGG